MKISAQMAQMIQGHDIKTLGGQVLVEVLSLLNEGDAKANISQVTGKVLTLEFVGTNLSLQIAVDESSAQHFLPGTEVKVSLTEQGKIQIEPQLQAKSVDSNEMSLETMKMQDIELKNEAKQDSSQSMRTEWDKAVSNMLVKHQLPNDPLIRDIVLSFLKNDISFTGETVKELKQTFQALNIVSQSLNENSLPVILEKMNLDLKRLAVQLMMFPETLEMNVDEALSKIEGTAIEPIVNALFSESMVKGDFIAKEVDGFQNMLLSMKVEDFISVLSDKSAVNLKEVILLLNSFKGIWSEHESFDKISNLIKSAVLTPKDVTEFFNILLSAEKPKEKLDSLENWIGNLKLNPSDESKIKTEMVFLKENLAISSKNTDEVYMFQIPIKINQDHKNVEFFIKRNKRKKDVSDAFQIYLALSTQRYEKVSCLVTGNSLEVNLKFGLENEAFVKDFSKQEPLLKTLISAVTRKKMNIGFEIKEKLENQFFLTNEKRIDPSGIDIRV